MRKKRYYVAMWTKKGFHIFKTNSLRLAKNPFLRMFARTIKVTDHVNHDVVYYKNREKES